MADNYPKVGQELLAQIPRLSQVAEAIGGQIDSSATTTEEGRLGAEMLRTALAVDQLVATGKHVKESVAELERLGGYEKPLLDALLVFRITKRYECVQAVEIWQLQSFMILDEEVRAKNGVAVMAKGLELNSVLIERIKNWHRGPGIVEPIRVRAPMGSAAQIPEPSRS